MKTKKFEKKLVLNKATISNLTRDVQNEIKAGLTPTWETFFECCPSNDLIFTGCDADAYCPFLEEE